MHSLNMHRDEHELECMTGRLDKPHTRRFFPTTYFTQIFFQSWQPEGDHILKECINT